MTTVDDRAAISGDVLRTAPAGSVDAAVVCERPRPHSRIRIGALVKRRRPGAGRNAPATGRRISWRA